MMVSCSLMPISSFLSVPCDILWFLLAISSSWCRVLKCHRRTRGWWKAQQMLIHDCGSIARDETKGAACTFGEGHDGSRSTEASYTSAKRKEVGEKAGRGCEHAQRDVTEWSETATHVGLEVRLKVTFPHDLHQSRVAFCWRWRTAQHYMLLP